MPLKYQAEIDNLNLSIHCPNNLTQLDRDVEVYRVAFTPVNHPDSFLPNVMFDRKYGIPFDYSARNKDEAKKCSRCGASFFKDHGKAKVVLEHFTRKNKENTGYSCVAKGTLSADDGLVKEGSEHITLYEFNNAILSNKFEIAK